MEQICPRASPPELRTFSFVSSKKPVLHHRPTSPSCGQLNKQDGDHRRRGIKGTSYSKHLCRSYYLRRILDGLQKTKAKSRYLKKKKERRKQRAKVAKVESDKKAKKVLRPAEHAAEESSSSEDDEDEEEGMNVDEEPQAPVVIEQKKSKEKKEKKKKEKKGQKLESSSEKQDVPELESAAVEIEVERGAEEDEAEDEGIDIDVDVDHQGPSTQIPTEDIIEPDIPLGVLPSFPLPSHPDAPSKSTLALQGLDKHITEAEIVHPSTVLPIPGEGAEDGGTRLSEKTRRRLKDLGITELFAGAL